MGKATIKNKHRSKHFNCKPFGLALDLGSYDRGIISKKHQNLIGKCFFLQQQVLFANCLSAYVLKRNSYRRHPWAVSGAR